MTVAQYQALQAQASRLVSLLPASSYLNEIASKVSLAITTALFYLTTTTDATGVQVLPAFTVATLPAPVAGNNLMYAIVTDGTTVTNGGAPTGGGSTVVLVQSNGATAWNCQ